MRNHENHRRICKYTPKYSVARHTQTATSDVDICFESDSISLFTLCRLKAELEDLLDCSVDLLRMCKQIEGSYLEKTIKRDMIYV